MAIQLFNEYDNYFSHMSRLCTNTCSGAQHQGWRWRRAHAIRAPSSLTFSLLSILLFPCPQRLHYFFIVFFWLLISFISAPWRTSAHSSVPSPSTNPHPDPIRLIMVILSRGKCHYGNRGRGSGGLSVGKRVRGSRREGGEDGETGNIEKDCEPSGRE